MPDNIRMALTSASTQADAIGQYKDNAAYSMVAGATLFAEACRVLLVDLPSGKSENSISLQQDTKLIQAELRKAERYIAQRSQGGSVRFHDFRDLRS